MRELRIRLQFVARLDFSVVLRLMGAARRKLRIGHCVRRVVRIGLLRGILRRIRRLRRALARLDLLETVITHAASFPDILRAVFWVRVFLARAKRLAVRERERAVLVQCQRVAAVLLLRQELRSDLHHAVLIRGLKSIHHVFVNICSVAVDKALDRREGGEPVLQCVALHLFRLGEFLHLLQLRLVDAGREKDLVLTEAGLFQLRRHRPPVVVVKNPLLLVHDAILVNRREDLRARDHLPGLRVFLRILEVEVAVLRVAARDEALVLAVKTHVAVQGLQRIHRDHPFSRLSLGVLAARIHCELHHGRNSGLPQRLTLLLLGARLFRQLLVAAVDLTLLCVFLLKHLIGAFGGAQGDLVLRLQMRDVGVLPLLLEVVVPLLLLLTEVHLALRKGLALCARLLALFEFLLPQRGVLLRLCVLIRDLPRLKRELRPLLVALVGSACHSHGFASSSN